MRHLFEIYRAQLKVTTATQLQYRVALVIWMIGIVLEPVIYLVVWATVARSKGGDVGGYNARSFAAYFLVLMLVNHLTQTWVFFEFEMRIRQGTLSPLLLKPVHPVHADVAQNVTFKLLMLVVLVPVMVVLALVFRPVIHPQWWGLALFAPTVLLAGVLRFLVEWTLGLAGFWSTRVSALNQIYYVALLFFSGQVAPLSLFPHFFQVIASVLPFRWTVSYPVELLLGRLSGRDALLGLAAQAGWILLSLVLLRVIWRAGLRKYSAVGA